MISPLDGYDYFDNGGEMPLSQSSLNGDSDDDDDDDDDDALTVVVVLYFLIDR